MAILPKGKGIWMHKYTQAPDVVVDNVVAAGLGHIALKIADGSQPYGADYPRQELITKLKAKGVQVWGWAYTYGDNPEREANYHGDLVLAFGLDGFAIDAEFEYKDQPVKASTYARTLRKKLLVAPIALATYRYPGVHANFPFRQFGEYVDFYWPQLYWVLSHNPVTQLAESMRQYSTLTYKRPYVPLASAWAQSNWAVRPAEIIAVLGSAYKQGLDGCSFWEYNHALAAGLWDSIVAFDWPVKGSEPPPPVTDIEELTRQIRDLSTLVDQQGSELRAAQVDIMNLKNAPKGLVYYPAKFNMNDRTPARFIAGWDKADPQKPTLEIYPKETSETKDRIFLDGVIDVAPWPIVAAGRETAYLVHTPGPVQLFVMAKDGILQK